MAPNPLQSGKSYNVKSKLPSSFFAVTRRPAKGFDAHSNVSQSPMSPDAVTVPWELLRLAAKVPSPVDSIQRNELTTVSPA
jgi:hypothetical protein